jgi:hypothetical protein
LASELIPPLSGSAQARCAYDSHFIPAHRAALFVVGHPSRVTCRRCEHCCCPQRDETQQGRLRQRCGLPEAWPERHRRCCPTCLTLVSEERFPARPDPSHVPIIGLRALFRFRVAGTTPEHDAIAGIEAPPRKGRVATIRPAVVKKPLDRAGKSDQNSRRPRWLIAP